MLRFKILASAIPLLIAGVFARSTLMPGPAPCIVLGDHSVQLTSSVWQAQRRVGFTDDPRLATVRVQIVDDAAAADFAVTDDSAATDSEACRVTAATRLVAITARSNAAPLIYLTRDNNADYRVYVSSQAFTAQDAAALVVGAEDADSRMTTASIAGGS
ncbi:MULTISPECIES: hypothetical protein [Rhodopseudomonas]|uniref:Signal peptide protein n=1 Tax=Rhodopseudomonas palustris TaxID=1076 RepID=A0A0D7F4P8_RHOPL|nr:MULTISPECIES: hypothetical protein [Rhodopseudomonas]KIZ47785.1 signal peptide protein [Rhodopseudomonas palustris]MDF3814040.1 hypothetical protein [Rhodopseudomonas sp. BAL398]WOK16478.1 hypothetical protein RBJ75_20300 [Rhodopseudomonas sp. BAL398]